VRTRVREYGGGGATVDRGTICYSNFSDQRLYRQTIGTAPAPLTPAPQEPAAAERSLRYADGTNSATAGSECGRIILTRTRRRSTPSWISVIFFQGDQDEVAPPNQTELMVSASRINPGCLSAVQ
jgi:hypothetical protein